MVLLNSDPVANFLMAHPILLIVLFLGVFVIAPSFKGMMEGITNGGRVTFGKGCLALIVIIIVVALAIKFLSWLF